MSIEVTTSAKPRRAGVLFPDLYTWVIFLSALDVMVTRIVLHFSGREANPIANFVLGHWGFAGMIAMKFFVVTFVVCACEYVGRTRPATARLLGVIAVGGNAAPVVAGLVQLAYHRWGV